MFVIPTRCLSANGNPKKNNNYYSYKTFKRLGIPALVYSGVSKVAVQLLQVKPKEIPKTHDGANGESKRRRVALVTGSNTGVGFETAKSLAQEHGLEVIIACRSVDKGVETCRKINEMSSRGMAVFVQSVNLADMQSVRAFANAVNRQYETIDVLVNNAGCNSVGASSSKNETGLDVVFSTNFLGHFLLTNLLLEKCRRIVNLASVMHHFPIYNNPAKDDISQLEFWKRMALEPKDEEEKSRRKTYGPSKLAALLFSIELNRRYGETKGIRSIAVNPGAVNSDIWRNYPSVMRYICRLFYLTSKQGSSTSVAAALIDLDPETVYLQPYLLPRQRKGSPPFPMFEMLGPHMGYVETTPRLPEDGGVKACQSLFQVSEELTGCSYTYSTDTND